MHVCVGKLNRYMVGFLLLQIAAFWLKMANAVSHSDMDEFNVIVADYETRVHVTYEVYREAFTKYIRVSDASLSQRRREVMSSTLDCIKYWREMADNSSVVLGDGEMVDHEPLYMIINNVNWTSPSEFNVSYLNEELSQLMRKVNDQINKWVDDNAADRLDVIQYLLERGIRQNDVAVEGNNAHQLKSGADTPPIVID